MEHTVQMPCNYNNHTMRSAAHAAPDPIRSDLPDRRDLPDRADWPADRARANLGTRAERKTKIFAATQNILVILIEHPAAALPPRLSCLPCPLMSRTSQTELLKLQRVVDTSTRSTWLVGLPRAMRGPSDGRSQSTHTTSRCTPLHSRL